MIALPSDDSQTEGRLFGCGWESHDISNNNVIRIIYRFGSRTCQPKVRVSVK